MAIPHNPDDDDTPLAIRTYPRSPHELPTSFNMVHVVLEYLKPPHLLVVVIVNSAVLSHPFFKPLHHGVTGFAMRSCRWRSPHHTKKREKKQKLKFGSHAYTYKKIPMADNLLKKGWLGDPLCVLCGEVMETVDHLLIGCVYTKFMLFRTLEDIQYL
ncbi:hypothetical protein ACMD2_20376 [Ananas comosus]|uniref:Reverse transcriptase zinc-binding domain-containing protein n=1 Tax=Ananas comosus TaxID=4615 RepID=A0A199VTT5_ANACO|nr:hypothetical protein ACMD2_20376 [Ananas comosus]